MMIITPELVGSLEPKSEKKCFCYDCKRKRRKMYLQNRYRKLHPKSVGKEEKILIALLKHKRTIEELSGIGKTTKTASRVHLSTLRKKGFKIKKKGSFYRIIRTIGSN